MYRHDYYARFNDLDIREGELKVSGAFFSWGQQFDHRKSTIQHTFSQLTQQSVSN